MTVSMRVMSSGEGYKYLLCTIAAADVETDQLIGAYVNLHGRRLNPVTIMKLRAPATLSTRPAKEVRSLAELTAAWRNAPGAFSVRMRRRWRASHPGTLYVGDAI